MRKDSGNTKHKNMNREEIISSMQEIPTETTVKVWVVQVEGKWYHISTFGGRYRIPEATGIWDSNKRGKRLTEKELFGIRGKDPVKCLNLFLDKIESEKPKSDELSA